MRLAHKILSFPFVLLIKLYQWIVSPIFPATCRYEPTCSQYAIESFKEWGVFKGFYLSLKRIISCRPGGKFGYDPVPKKSN